MPPSREKIGPNPPDSSTSRTQDQFLMAAVKESHRLVSSIRPNHTTHHRRGKAPTTASSPDLITGVEDQSKRAAAENPRSMQEEREEGEERERLSLK
ncbi:hypothetical protein ISN44_As10g010160 [Arabidopsis suecica]|uniref:Uncharacterized protein n=1 Tax=Arabidopsis suecica TaxID=45249 RepID=A0A8T1ZXE2_ARASU|nr:hypothetical protein ISN44_As10g010160 [Arabidopsis suecica]